MVLRKEIEKKDKYYGKEHYERKERNQKLPR